MRPDAVFCPLCARSPRGKLRVVGAWLARRVAGRVTPRLAVVGRSTSLTSRLGQLQLLRPSLLGRLPLCALRLPDAAVACRGRRVARTRGQRGAMSVSWPADWSAVHVSPLPRCSSRRTPPCARVV
jgi:hypothetical protein